MNSKIKLVGSTVGAVALLTPAVAAAVPVEAQTIDAPAAVAAACETEVAAETATVPVEGAFSYDQGVVTSTQAIAEVFNKAAASLCAALPQYEVDAQGRVLCVKSPGTSFSATVEDMAEEGAESYVIGCACASNGPGGGAVMNAEVSGVSLEAVADMAGA